MRHAAQEGGRMIDFGEEWRRGQKLRNATDSADAWSARAKRFDNTDKKSAYADAFLERACIDPGAAVLDMGCGTGAVSLPLARLGHRVCAADFSEGMLEVLNAKAASIDASLRPRTVRMAWEDDWDDFGMGEDAVDVAVASRSLSTPDLEAALRKLDRVARTRCCITVATGASPKLDEKLLAEIGVKPRSMHTHAFAVGILSAAGREPVLSYIHSQRRDTFATRDEAFAKFSGMIDGSGACFAEGEREAAERRLDAWIERHLVANETAGRPDSKGMPQKAFRLDAPRDVAWAFISWSTHGPWLLDTHREQEALRSTERPAAGAAAQDRLGD